ncbi:MAG: hypothetical protein IH631_04910, partial [Candidatus Thorarchaeota archaeon]|nr:hypothetical protein [Candidatus Thorarchaeota archaeon]
SADHADVFQNLPVVFTLDHTEPPLNLIEPIIQLKDTTIRISSMRVHDDTILVTLYNLDSKDITTDVHLAEYIKSIAEVRLDGTIIRDHSLNKHTTKLSFGAREIKMCQFRRT